MMIDDTNGLVAIDSFASLWRCCLYARHVYGMETGGAVQ